MKRKEYIKKIKWSEFIPKMKKSITLHSREAEFIVTINSEKSQDKNREKALKIFNAHLDERLKNINVKD